MKKGNIYIIKEKNGMIGEYLGRENDVYSRPKGTTPNSHVFNIVDYWDYKTPYDNNRVAIYDSFFNETSPFIDITGIKNLLENQKKN